MEAVCFSETPVSLYESTHSVTTQNGIGISKGLFLSEQAEIYV
jgi:hypothetical protein